MKTYDNQSRPLFELLDSACTSDKGAELLIPDLQRPYVWNPQQVVLLVDTILRGWPFGSLLLWKISDAEQSSIPSRTFWSVIDRVTDAPVSQGLRASQPAEFRMVLDGQQRIQSLLLAFYGDSTGFKMSDADWNFELSEGAIRKTRATKQSWAIGSLCLDLDAFENAARGSIANVNFRDILCWVVKDKRDESPGSAKRQQKLIRAYEEPYKSRFLRLSRLWFIAKPRNDLKESWFKTEIAKELRNHGVTEERLNSLLPPLGELLTSLRDVKLQKIDYLELSAWDRELTSEESYNQAIVNIFTRLNTGGRTLTREEITFAWIKHGWDAARTDNLTAEVCFKKLRADLEDTASLTTDQLVMIVSSMWSVLFHDGKLLSEAELLKGNVVAKMADELSKDWKHITDSIVTTANLISKRQGLEYKVHYKSLNSLIILLTWKLIGDHWIATQMSKQRSSAKHAAEKSLLSLFCEFCDRWLILCQWTGQWGKTSEKTFRDYIGQLSGLWQELRTETDREKMLDRLQHKMSAWDQEMRKEAIGYIEQLAGDERDDVTEYFLPLWLWHRLDKKRWDASKISLKDGSGRKLASWVDHIVPVKQWPAIAKRNTGGENSPEISEDNVEHAIGNCCLLEKTFNISKSGQSLQVFLEEMEREGILDNAEKWRNALLISPYQVSPMLGSYAELADSIRTRTKRIKTDLQQFVNGALRREDLARPATDRAA